MPLLAFWLCKMILMYNDPEAVDHDMSLSELTTSVILQCRLGRPRVVVLAVVSGRAPSVLARGSRALC